MCLPVSSRPSEKFWEVLLCAERYFSGFQALLSSDLGKYPGVESDSAWVSHDGYFVELQKISAFS